MAVSTLIYPEENPSTNPAAPRSIWSFPEKAETEESSPVPASSSGVK